MTRICRYAALSSAVVALAGGATHAWISIPAQRTGIGTAIARFPNGDLVATITFARPPNNDDLAVIRVDGATGATIWLREFNLPSFDEAVQVAVDSAGNVVTANILKGIVYKLDGETGNTIWQTRVSDAGHGVEAFALDANDDVVVGGMRRVIAGGPEQELFVKLAGGDGATVWSVLGGAGSVTDLRTGPTGDVFTASMNHNSPGSARWTFRRLDGNDGHTVWERPRPVPETGFEGVRDIALDGSSRVVALISWELGATNRWEVDVLDQASGEGIWAQTIDASPKSVISGAGPARLAVAVDGTIYAAGSMEHASFDTGLAVLAFDAATGAERWRYVPRGGGLARSLANDLALAPDGTVVVTGRAIRRHGESKMIVTKLRPADGMRLWEATANLMPDSTGDRGMAVAIGPSGNISATGILAYGTDLFGPALVELYANGADAGPSIGLRPFGGRPEVREP